MYQEPEASIWRRMAAPSLDYFPSSPNRENCGGRSLREQAPCGCPNGRRPAVYDVQVRSTLWARIRQAIWKRKVTGSSESDAARSASAAVSRGVLQYMVTARLDERYPKKFEIG